MIDIKQVCCFSGHRVIQQEILPQIEIAVEKAVIELISKGVIFFGSGGALGFDQIAAETILRLKKEYPHIRLVMVLPCPPEQQSLKWNDEQKKRYFNILEQADKVRVLSPQYTNNCMLDRNRHMVDNSAYLVCYLRKSSGGTFYTVNYAENRDLQIWRI